jgi:hypothetical protein
MGSYSVCPSALLAQQKRKKKNPGYDHASAEAALGVLFFAAVFSLTLQTERVQRRTKRVSTEDDTPESILEPSRHALKVAHSARPGRLSAFSLLAPLVRAQFGGWVSALGALCNIGSARAVYCGGMEAGNADALLCCMWKARLPHRRQSVCDFEWRLLSAERYG